MTPEEWEAARGMVNRIWILTVYFNGEEEDSKWFNADGTFWGVFSTADIAKEAVSRLFGEVTWWFYEGEDGGCGDAWSAAPKRRTMDRADGPIVTDLWIESEEIDQQPFKYYLKSQENV